jgi:DNA-binding CsgD family transcriptional regulator
VVALRERDVRGALDFVRTAGAVSGPDPFPVELLAYLRRVIPSQALSWHEWSVDGGNYRQTISASVPAQTADVWHAYSEFRHQDPLPGGCDEARRPPRGAVGRTVKLSDLVSDRAFRRLELYQHVCRPLEIDHVMKLFLPVRDGVARCFVFDRTGRDFSERDRAVVDLLRPHFVQLEDAARLRRLAATLARGAGPAGARVVLNRANRIELATARARTLLDRYDLQPRGARLPLDVETWLARPAGGGGALRFARGGRSLVVECVESEQRVLALREEAAGTELITEREREVLALVAEGHSNGEIAAALWIAPGTVRKHLDNVYAKLGVSTRTAAASRLRDGAGTSE